MNRLALLSLLFCSINLVLQADIYAMRHNCWWHNPCVHGKLEDGTCKHYRVGGIIPERDR